MIIRKRTRKESSRAVLYRALIRSINKRRKARRVEGRRDPRDIAERWMIAPSNQARRARLQADIELEQAEKEMVQAEEYYSPR